MKQLVIIIAVALFNFTYGQDYQLIPDSCSFCFYSTSTGGNSWYSNNYGIDPSSDTSLLGNSYIKLSNIDYDFQPFAIRQEGNKLYGVIHDSTSEVLIMDFDANIGDTIFNLYSEGYNYHARVSSKDSFLVNNGVYHHNMRLSGISIFNNGSWEPGSWGIKWNERGLCIADIVGFDWDYGGVLFNIPYDYYVISVSYLSPSYCTTDLST